MFKAGKIIWIYSTDTSVVKREMKHSLKHMTLFRYCYGDHMLMVEKNIAGPNESQIKKSTYNTKEYILSLSNIWLFELHPR